MRVSFLECSNIQITETNKKFINLVILKLFWNNLVICEFVNLLPFSSLDEKSCNKKHTHYDQYPSPYKFFELIYSSDQEDDTDDSIDFFFGTRYFPSRSNLTSKFLTVFLYSLSFFFYGFGKRFDFVFYLSRSSFCCCLFYNHDKIL